MSELVHLSADADTQTIVDTLTRDGALILDNVVDADFLAALRSETDPYMEATSNGSDDFAGRQTTRTGGLLMRSQKCRDLIGDPRILTALPSNILGRIASACNCILPKLSGSVRASVHSPSIVTGGHGASICAC